MILLFCIALFLITVTVIAFPLFFQKLTPHREGKSSADFDEQDSLLTALSDLEEEFQLGRVSNKDYERMKLHFQRKYLELKSGK